MKKVQIDFIYKEAEKRTSVHAEQIAFAVGAQWALEHLKEIQYCGTVLSNVDLKRIAYDFEPIELISLREEKELLISKLDRLNNDYKLLATNAAECANDLNDIKQTWYYKLFNRVKEKPLRII